jgi:hypothetical protein
MNLNEYPNFIIYTYPSSNVIYFHPFKHLRLVIVHLKFYARYLYPKSEK